MLLPISCKAAKKVLPLHSQKEMTMRNVIYTLFILIALAACNTHQGTRAQLDKAEALMTEHPDSALATLQQVDEAQLSTEKLQARFALLLSMALDKNYIDIASDSLIHPAVDYYENHGSSREKMLTCYYLANVLYNAKETAKCLISLTDAEKYAKSIEDHFYLGMIYRMMADAYNTIYCHNEEVNYYQLSYDHFSKTNSRSHINFALLNLGLGYSNNHDYDQALNIFNKVLDIASHESDDVLTEVCLQDLGHTHRLCGNYRESIKAILQLEQMYPKQVRSRDYSNIANCYAELQMPDSAIFYMQKAEALTKRSVDTQVTYDINYKLSKYKGDFQTALDNYEKLFDLNANITDSIMGKSVLVTLQDYIVQQAEYDNYIASQKRNKLYYIIAFLILGIIAASIILYQRWQNKNQEIEKNIQLAQSISDALRTKEHHLSSMSEQIHALFSQQFDSINQLCNVYYDSQGTKFEKDRIYKEVKKQIESLGTENAKQLEDIINNYNDNLLLQFKTDFPTLSKDYHIFATYLFAGFSARAISLFMDNKVENIYNMKSRLKSRIANSNSSYKEKYLLMMT